MYKIKYLVVFVICFTIQKGYAQDLMETYQLAIDNDPEFRSAYLNQFSTAENKSQSIARMLPNVSLIASSSRDRLDNKKVTFQRSGVQNYWSHALTLNFSQPVFHLEHWVQLSQSENQIAQAEAQYQAQHQALMVKTADAYFNILAAQDNLEFTIAEKTAIEKQLEQAKQRFEVGLIAITDVYEAQAAYDQARANEIVAANLLDDEKEILRELIGENNKAELNPLHDKIRLNLPEPTDISSWDKVSETNNFNIIAQLNQTEVARKAVLLQQTGHLPTVDVVGNYSFQDSNSTFGLRGDTRSIGLQLNFPIFEGGAVYSRSKQAQYEYRREKENLTKVKRSVIRQVRNAFRGVITSLSQVKALKATVKSSESALEATEAGFEVGTRTMVDVLAEQRNLFRSKRDYARSRYDYLINGIKLKEAAGSLTEADLEQVNQFLTDQ